MPCNKEGEVRLAEVDTVARRYEVIEKLCREGLAKIQISRYKNRPKCSFRLRAITSMVVNILRLTSTIS
ncbi:MAG: hypothetical protein JSV96_04080 [Candidatus Aminicenantes bacterium]|nr:MAG: hypothetical protein JSV96_04080 [Candidatus Aminicenantes bacterium]